MTTYSAGSAGVLAVIANSASAGDVRRFDLTAKVSSSCVGTYKFWAF